MARGLFVSGTDTGVGKTVVASALLRLAARTGVRAVGLKPVASGSERGPEGLRNADALALRAAAPMPLPYETVNPYCFEPAIAPHIAASEAGVPVTIDALLRWYAEASVDADLAIVEGAGGWRVPLHPRGFLSDLPESLGLEVVLVVGLRLGCLNHARLTFEAIAASGRCPMAGWIANEVDPTYERLEQNVATLSDLLGSRPLARVRHVPGAGRDHEPLAVELADTPALRRLLAARA